MVLRSGLVAWLVMALGPPLGTCGGQDRKKSPPEPDAACPHDRRISASVVSGGSSYGVFGEEPEFLCF